MLEEQNIVKGQAFLEARPSLRRLPRQERGEQRITRILDAAAQVFDEVGYEAATTTIIAARAGTAIGSLYQFFPNKEAIVQGLLDRYRAQLHTIFAQILTPELPSLPLLLLLDRLIDPLIEFELGQHGFKALFINVPPSATLASGAKTLTDEVVQQISMIFIARLPAFDAALALRYSQIAVQIVKAFLTLAASSSLSREDATGELKTVLLAYLGPIVGLEGRATQPTNS